MRFFFRASFVKGFSLFYVYMLGFYFYHDECVWTKRGVIRMWIIL